MTKNKDETHRLNCDQKREKRKLYIIYIYFTPRDYKSGGSGVLAIETV